MFSWDGGFILASKSPRRKYLLEQIGLSFEIIESSYKENLNNGSDPEKFVIGNSFGKANDVSKGISEGIILGADTIVHLNGRILGKPADKDEAEKMLSLLSGKTHIVYTGVTLIKMPDNMAVSGYASTKVTFRHLEKREILDYIESGEPMDKAGSYGIQGKGALLVEKIDGCYYNVMGLPLVTIYKLFKSL